MDKVRQYLHYIGVGDIRAPDLDFLRELQSKHILTVPFENWDIHTGIPIRIDEEAFLHKILVRKRGGFCYELNGAFGWLLEQLGYKISRLSARVSRASGGLGPEFDHLTLLVHLGNGYIADVGFGASSQFPLPLGGEQVASTLTAYRIHGTDDGLYCYQSLDKGEWHLEYVFSLVDHPLSAFADMCNFHQTSADSPFPKRPLCTKATAEGRIWIRGDMFVTATPQGTTERSITTSERDELLKELFTIEL